MTEESWEGADAGGSGRTRAAHDPQRPHSPRIRRATFQTRGRSRGAPGPREVLGQCELERSSRSQGRHGLRQREAAPAENRRPEGASPSPWQAGARTDRRAARLGSGRAPLRGSGTRGSRGPPRKARAPGRSSPAGSSPGPPAAARTPRG